VPQPTTLPRAPVPYKGYFNNVTYFTVLTKRGGNEKGRKGMKDKEIKEIIPR
jgi:hypothetical protein